MSIERWLCRSNHERHTGHMTVTAMRHRIRSLLSVRHRIHSLFPSRRLCGVLVAVPDDG
jgi:hypothetical protein